MQGKLFDLTLDISLWYDDLFRWAATACKYHPEMNQLQLIGTTFAMLRVAARELDKKNKIRITQNTMM